jgi:hypothetical protein
MRPSRVILFRHAEKPADDADHDLSPRGRERAAALAELLGGPSDLRPDVLFATRTESDGGGVRTQQTLAPLAERLGLEVRCPFKKDQYERLAAHVLEDASLAGKVVAICWNHTNLPAFAAALGLGDGAPSRWDKDTFDRFWVISYEGGPARLRELLQPIILGNPETAELLEDPPGPFRKFVRAPRRRGQEVATFAFAAGASDGKTNDAEAELAPFDLPLASIADLERLKDALDADPEEVLARAKIAFGANLDEATLRERLDIAVRALKAPHESARLLDAEHAVDFATTTLPPDFGFDGYDPNEIPIDASSRKFEEVGDLLGWMINSGRYALGYSPGPKRDFRWHDAPAHASRFLYPLRRPPAGDLRIALVSDFGTGLYTSRYIAKQLLLAQYDYAIHLGDVYYSGREAEFAEYFRKELDPLLGFTRLFTMNGNHEMFSVAKPYFRYLDARRDHPSGLQEQEGSYFCLRGDRVQIIAIDTDYFGPSRFRDPSLLKWLEHHLEAGRAARLTNILLSGDEPYDYGSSGTTKLLGDLRSLVVGRSLVDLWFWGNTHYCALFEPTAALPFIGSCIGHGGFPYGTQRPSRPSAAPVAFLETGARFPAWTRVRQDRGNNGFCEMTVQDDGGLVLRYIDWMKNDRCRVVLDRRDDGRLVMQRPEVLL